MQEPKRGRRPIYPWKKWIGQKSGRLTRGKDYKCQTHGMANQLRNVASKLNLKISVSTFDNYLEYAIVD